MNIGIVTIQSVNYGNRLQNYALQETLKKRGFSVQSLRRSPNGVLWKSLVTVRDLLKNDWVKAFRDFDKQFVELSDLVLSTKRISVDIDASFDKFVIGSDQVWNPDFSFNSELEYLPMIDANKKLAYAASFGVSSIHRNTSRTAELLNDIPYISVREDAGAAIVRELTGRDVPVVLDPTLLVSVEDWSLVAKKPKCIDGIESPFVFKYVLGSDVNGEAIEVFARECGLVIIDAMDPSNRVGPSEFVWLIAYSSMVCTDSFHASVFALLHHKPLAIFERVSDDADMSSRFDTLCRLFGLRGHRSSEKEFSLNMVKRNDWVAFESRLSDLRLHSEKWLDDALGDVGAND